MKLVNRPKGMYMMTPRRTLAVAALAAAAALSGGMSSPATADDVPVPSCSTSTDGGRLAASCQVPQYCAASFGVYEVHRCVGGGGLVVDRWIPGS